MVLGDGRDVLDLIGGEKEDPRGQYGVRKHSIVPNGGIEGLQLKGVGLGCYYV